MNEQQDNTKKQANRMDMPFEELRILLLEDSTSDAELEESELRDAGLAFTLLRVDAREAFERALDEFKPDIVIADYNLPAYNGLDALKYMRHKHPQIPVIIATGSLGDEAAVELLKLGARDYVLKDRLARLAPAIKRALSEECGIRNRKLAEATFRESEERFRSIFENARDVILTLSIDGILTSLSPAFEPITGWPRDEWLGKSFFPLVHPDDLPVAMQLLQRSMRGETLPMFELRTLKKSGDYSNSEFTIAPLTHDGKITHLLGIARDISERKRVEDKLRESEEKFRKMSDSAQDAIIMMDAAGKISFWNKAAEIVFGYSAEEALGQELHELIAPPFTRVAVKHGLEHFFASGEGPTVGKRMEVVAIRKNGAEFPVDLSVSAVLLGGEWHSIGIVHDITERKQAEDALLNVNRALKTLSACNHTLAHSNSEEQLLQAMCDTIVEKGGYLMAWVGYAQQDEAKTVQPVAQYAVRPGYLDGLVISWGDGPAGYGPTGTAVREGRKQIAQHIATDPRMAQWRDKALSYGYHASIALPLLEDGRPLGALTIYAAEPDAFNTEEVALLEELAGDLAYGIQSLRTRIERDQAAEKNRQYLDQISTNLTETIQAIAATVEMRDPYTAGHEKRVAELSVAIGQELGMAKEQLDGLRIAGTVHDVGKIRIPAEILSKPLRLNELEYGLIKLHPEAGYDILKGINFPWPIAAIVWQHHERLDGSGYPRGLKGSEILLEAQILAVADVVESILSHRPYRPALGLEAAFGELMDKRGKLYNADAVDACIKLFREKGFVFSK